MQFAGAVNLLHVVHPFQINMHATHSGHNSHSSHLCQRFSLSHTQSLTVNSMKRLHHAKHSVRVRVMKTQMVLPYLLSSVTLQPGGTPTESGSGTSLSCGFCIIFALVCVLVIFDYLANKLIIVLDLSVKQHIADLG